ncbi:unnamed protein product [Effrenium voratum]|nr:unnamed protein product [Effrenium voratum]
MGSGCSGFAGSWLPRIGFTQHEELAAEIVDQMFERWDFDAQVKGLLEHDFRLPPNLQRFFPNTWRKAQPGEKKLQEQDKAKFEEIRQFFYYHETNGCSMTHCSLMGSADTFTNTGKWFFPDSADVQDLLFKNIGWLYERDRYFWEDDENRTHAPFDNIKRCQLSVAAFKEEWEKHLEGELEAMHDGTNEEVIKKFSGYWSCVNKEQAIWKSNPMHRIGDRRAALGHRCGATRQAELVYIKKLGKVVLDGPEELLHNFSHPAVEVLDLVRTCEPDDREVMPLYDVSCALVDLWVQELSAKQAVDEKKVSELQSRLEEAKCLADERWQELERKQEENARLSEELQKQTLHLQESAQSKFQLEEEKMRRAQETRAFELQLELLQREKAATEGQLQALQKELSDAKGEAKAKSGLLEENARQVQKMAEDVEAARVEAELQKEDARLAREVEQREMQLKEAAERELQEVLRSVAKDRASHEESLKQMTQKLEQSQEELSSTQARLEAAAAAQAARLAEASEAELTTRKELEELRAKQDSFSSAPTTGLPTGNAKLADLLYEATTSREEAVKERQLREQYQEALETVGREIKERQPALMSQREELLRLKTLTARLTKQNEELLARVEQLQSQCMEAEARAKKCSGQQKLLEGHVREVADQMVVLIHENRRLSGALPEEEHPGDLKAYEAQKRGFRTVQELVDQNLSLRRSVAQLLSECEDEAQKELQLLRQRELQLEAKLKEQELQYSGLFEELKKHVQQLEQERDKAKEKIKALEAQDAMQGVRAAEAAAPTSSGVQEASERQAALSAQEQQQEQLAECRHSATEARRKAAEVQEELGSTREAKEQLQARAACGVLARWQAAGGLCLEYSELRAMDLQAEIHQAKREKSHLEVELSGQKCKVAGWEQTCENLLAEKSKLFEHVIHLQARMECESKALDEMKQKLEEQHGESEALTRKQLALSEQRQKDLQRTAEERRVALEARKAEAEEAKSRIEDLEAKAEKLEAKVTSLAQENHELREAGAARPRRGAEVQSFSGNHATGEVAQRLALAEESLKEQKKFEELLKNLLSQHEADLKSSKEEMQKMENTLAEFQEKEERAKEAKKVQEALEAKIEEMHAQAQEVRQQLHTKDQELEEVKKECAAKDKELAGKLEKVELERAQESDNERKWEKRYQEQLNSHAADLDKLSQVEQQLKDSEKQLQNAKKMKVLLEAKTRRASEEQEIFKGRLGEADQKVKTLTEEIREYRDQLLALPEAEALQRLGNELRAANRQLELSQTQLEQTEAERDRLEEEAHAANTRAKQLQEKLSAEQRELLRLQRGSRLEQKALAKLSQMEALDTELRGLKVENRSLQERLEGNREAAQHRELQKEWQAQKVTLTEKLEQLQETLKTKDSELQSLQELKAQLAEKKQALESEQGKLQDMLKEKEQVQSQLKTKDAEVQQQEKKSKADQNLKELHMKKIAEHERTIASLQAERTKLTTEAAKTVPQAEVTKLREENQQLKAKLEEGQQAVSEERSKSQELVKAKGQLLSDLKNKDAELKNSQSQLEKQVSEVKKMEGVKSLHSSKIADNSKEIEGLKVEAAKQKEENAKLKAEILRLTAQASQAAKRKAESAGILVLGQAGKSRATHFPPSERPPPVKALPIAAKAPIDRDLVGI